jgi:hypothetical protein
MTTNSIGVWPADLFYKMVDRICKDEVDRNFRGKMPIERLHEAGRNRFRAHPTPHLGRRVGGDSVTIFTNEKAAPLGAAFPKNADQTAH